MDCKFWANIYNFICLQVLKGKHIKYKFEELAAHFEQALGDISYHKFDISDEVKEQVNIHCCKFFFFFERKVGQE
jgi:hypothetical protein